MNEVIWFLLFFIPAYVANMAPVFVRRLNILNYPVDGGIKFRGKRLLGTNKTVRGFVFGTLLGGLAGYCMQLGGLAFTWWWGFVLGFAALLGDSIKSFFKRQVGIRPGGRWMPFDQVDFLIVAYAASTWFVSFTYKTTVSCFAIIFGLTIIVQLIGGWTKLKADSL